MQLDEAITRYVRWMRDEQDFREQTVYRVERQIRHLAGFAEWKMIGDIDAESVAEVLRKKRPNWAPETAKSYTDAIRGLTRVATQKGWLASDPLKGFIGVRDKGTGEGVRALSEDEIRRLIAAASRTDKGRARYADRKRVRVAYYMLLWYTGVRRKASKALQWRDVDFDAARIRVRPEADKARRGYATSIAPPLADALKEIRPVDAQPTDLLFPQLPSTQTLKLDLAHAGITGRVGWHSFRKGIASKLASDGVPTATIAKQTGHRSLDVLANSYVDPTLCGLSDAIGKLGDVSCKNQKRPTGPVDRPPISVSVNTTDAPDGATTEPDAGVTQWSIASNSPSESVSAAEVSDARTDATIQFLEAVIRLLRGG